MDGTAVARIVESMATRLVLSISAMSSGPRSERNPTLELTRITLPAFGWAGG